MGRELRQPRSIPTPLHLTQNKTFTHSDASTGYSPIRGPLTSTSTEALRGGSGPQIALCRPLLSKEEAAGREQLRRPGNKGIKSVRWEGPSDGVIREGFSEEVTFHAGLKGKKGFSHGRFGGKTFQAEGTTCAQA